MFSDVVLFVQENLFRKIRKGSFSFSREESLSALPFEESLKFEERRCVFCQMKGTLLRLFSELLFCYYATHSEETCVMRGRWPTPTILDWKRKEGWLVCRSLRCALSQVSWRKKRNAWKHRRSLSSGKRLPSRTCSIHKTWSGGTQVNSRENKLHFKENRKNKKCDMSGRKEREKMITTSLWSSLLWLSESDGNLKVTVAMARDMDEFWSFRMTGRLFYSRKETRLKKAGTGFLQSVMWLFMQDRQKITPPPYLLSREMTRAKAMSSRHGNH